MSAPAGHAAARQAVERFVSEFSRVKGSLAGAELPWVSSFRERAIEEFSRHGLPSTRDEAWHYTSLAPLIDADFRVDPVFLPAELEPAVGRVSLADVAARLVFCDGRLVGSLSRLPGADGLTISLLYSNESGLKERVEGEGRALGFTRERSLLALNAALAAEAWLVRVPPGARLRHPVEILYFSSGAEPGLASFPRVEIEIGEGASASVLETHAGLGEGGRLTNASTRLAVGKGGRLEYVRLQAEPESARHLGWIDASLARGSELGGTLVSLGGGWSRVEATARIEGEGARARVDGLYCARGKQHVDHQVTVDHGAAGGKSSQEFKGILDGKGRGVLSSKVIVRPGAQKSDSSQGSRSLLLSDDAETDAKPLLEIYADDVKCSHGATVGRLDPASVFYLRSRGIAEKEARALLTSAFAEEVLERVGDSAVARRLREEVSRWLSPGRVD